MSIADRVTNVKPHTLKEILSKLGVSQAHVAKFLGRGPSYIHQRLNGFAKFKDVEESKLSGLVSKVQAATTKEAAHV